MKLSDLLASRRTLIRQAALANMAHAYQTLTRFADRVAAARLQGRVRLRQSTDPEDAGWATLTALTGSQAVIEEHFTDDEILELAEAVFFTVDLDAHDLTFALEEFGARFQAPVREAFEKAGVTVDVDVTQSRGQGQGQANAAG